MKGVSAVEMNQRETIGQKELRFYLKNCNKNLNLTLSITLLRVNCHQLHQYSTAVTSGQANNNVHGPGINF